MKIAIQGHPFRGKEVIQILESLGGKNIDKLEGVYKTFYYINDKNEIVDDHKTKFPPTYKLYTLEEFETQFPFKVGDLCIYSSDIIGEDIVVKILGMTIENDCIMYEVGHRDITNKHSYIYRKRNALKPYKEMKEERNITLTLNKAKEWYNKGGELKEVALQAFSEKELNPLPRSWEEYGIRYGSCCFSTRYTNIPLKYDALLKLEQLRDCWRQGWEPDWNNTKQTKYCIAYYQGKFKISILCETRYFLSFPTMKMAEEFLECFRDLIEKAGDLI